MGNQPPKITGLQFLAFTLIGLAFFVGSGIFLNPFRNIEASIYESPVFATAAEARVHLTILLPDEATNIRFAGYREWLAAEDYMRFEAPAEVCFEHAAKLFPNLQLAAEPILEQTKSFAKSSHFQDLIWFDLYKARNVLSAANGNEAIFIDQERGVFYYHYID